MAGVSLSGIVPGTCIARADDLEWTVLDSRDGQVRTRFFGESPETGPWILQVDFAPGYQEPPHWHDHDTIYIPTRGAMVIGAEGRVGVGDVRWVRAGTFYGPEAAADEGCEFWLISHGPPGYHAALPTPAELAALRR